MALATVELCETNGDSGSPTINHNVTNFNFGSVDEHNTVPASSKITIEASGGSMTKWWGLHVTGMGTSLLVNNIKIWKDSGVYKTSELIKFKDTATYVTPVKTQLAGTATIATSSPGSSNVTGEIAAAGYSQYMACQTWVSTDTEPGAANQKVIKVSYDES
jgi:hypothetical protein